MRMTKKLFTTLLALAMAMALALPAFAAAPDNYSITINNDQAGHTYQAYQIFSGTVSNDDQQNGEAAGPMLGDITWGTGVNGEALLAALQVADQDKYGACKTAADVAKALGAEGATAEDAAAFADIVVNYLAGAPTGQTAEHVGGASYVIGGLPAGYYLVKDVNVPQTGTATDYIVQVLGNVTMEPKDTDIPTLEKKVYDEEYAQEEWEDIPYGVGYNDVADWDIGDRVPFKLIAAVPDDLNSYETYQFIFHDTLSTGLTLDEDSIKVFAAETTAANLNQFTPQDADLYEVTVGENGAFTITIPNIKALDAHNNPVNYVIVTYDAILNANAEIGLPGNPNSASLEFSNDPNDAESTGETAEDTVIVFTYELDGTKVDGKDADTTLADAQFVLLSSGKTQAAVVVNNKVTGWVQVHSEAAVGEIQMPETYEEWVERYGEQNVILTSRADGTFKIAGLDDGTYYLREIKAPDGYNLLEDDVEIVITAATENGQNWNGVAADALTGLNVTTKLGENGIVTEGDGNVGTGIVAITVANNQGATLPETGGVGTTLFYIIGGVLVVAAVVVLVARRRAGSREE